MRYQKQDQSGAASLLFTLIMIIIISLLAIGFSVITTNDQKETLNKNLASNTEYAAQSAINSVIEGITAKNPLVVASKNTCQNNANNGIIPTFPESNTSISCVKWTYNPASLSYNATNAASTVINPQTSDTSPSPTTMTELNITWSLSTGKNLYTKPSLVDLTSASSGNFPILKIVTSNTNMSNFKTTYVYPTSNNKAPTVNDISGSSINIIQTKCSSKLTCSVKLSGFNGLSGWKGDSAQCPNSSNCGLVSVTVLDGSQTALTISGKDSKGSSITLSDSQIQIDATAVNGNSVKRLIAGYTINQSSGWSPSFVAGSAQVLGKNYRYDFPSGTSASNPGPASTATYF